MSGIGGKQLQFHTLIISFSTPAKPSSPSDITVLCHIAELFLTTIVSYTSGYYYHLTHFSFISQHNGS